MIDQQEIAALAGFYDGYANALDPHTPERDLAKRQFLARLEALYQREAAGVPFDEFRLEMVRHCKAYLRRN